MTTSATAVDFFVRFAEAEGALAELVPEGAVLLLPDALQDVCRLPEEVRLTEDPEVGREEGYVLLSPGHPVLRSAAEHVLSHGDVGSAHLPWPSGLPPSPATLEQWARDRLHPEHGRIHVAGAPAGVYVAVLRVGALVTHRISIDEQVQEIEEAWVVVGGATEAAYDAPPDLVARLRSLSAAPGQPPGAALWGGGGVAAADRQLRAGAARRSSDLARQASRRLLSQLDVVDDYYRRVLGSIEERRARATPDRDRMLAAQAEATKSEWTRRRAEVTDELTPEAELRPFRLHLIGVPAWRFDAVIRRGPRAYPLTMTFVPLTSSFLPTICPSCGSSAQLVAGKERLACRECSKPDTPGAAHVTGAEETPARGQEQLALETGDSSRQGISTTGGEKASAARAGSPRSSDGPSGSSRRVGSAAAVRSPGRVSPRGSPGRATPKGGISGRQLKAGDRLTRLIWESVLNDERLKQRNLVSCSPISALVRLYDVRGPALVVGMHDSENPRGFTSSNLGVSGDGVVSTVGAVLTSQDRELPFSFDWRYDTGRLLSIEAWPLERYGPLLASNDVFGATTRARLAESLRPPPAPEIPLGSFGLRLLRLATEFAGLSYATRCLAAWWYLIGDVDADAGAELAPTELLAAAVEAVVARRAGIRLTSNAVAERYGCELEAIRTEVRRIQVLVKAAPIAGW